MKLSGKIIAALAGTMLTASAMAADLPAPVYKAPAYKAPVVALWIWNGSYIGGNVGYGWGPWDSTSLSNIFGGGTGLTNVADPHVDGWLGGLQIGHNWQNGAWLLGVEADFQLTGQKGNNDGSRLVAVVPLGDGTLTVTQNASSEWALPWFATLRGRVGVTSNQWLFYGTGGLAVGRVKFSNTTTLVGTAVRTSGTTVTSITTDLSDAKTQFGFAVGAGIERALSDRWSVKAEYLYLDFGSPTFLLGTGADTTVNLRDHIVRFGVNYKFWDGQ